MISLIICSRSKDISKKLRENVEETIGTDFEWVIIDNSAGNLSIFKAYNLGVKRAHGNILCFMHDDILFLSNKWGEVVNNAFRMENLGLLGVIGNHVVPACPASWWTACYEEGHVIQYYESEKRQENLQYFKVNNRQVSIVDGLWFCIPHSLFSSIDINEKTFSGFHCYDTDICLQILKQGRTISVANNIDIQHNSDGFLSPQFIKERQLWFDKWKSMLPICQGIDLSQNELEAITQMAERQNKWTLESIIAHQEIRRLKDTHAYRLGKKLLRPLNILKRK